MERGGEKRFATEPTWNDLWPYHTILTVKYKEFA